MCKLNRAANLLLVFCFAFRLAAADPLPDSSGNLTQGIEEAQDIGYPDDGTALKAYWFAVGGTVLPGVIGMAIALAPGSDPILIGLGMMSAGVVIGPSLGQYYAGSPIQATVGIAIRGAGLGLAVAGLAEGMEEAGCRWRNKDGEDEDCDQNGSSRPIFTIGSIILGAGVLYGFIDTHFAVDRKMERARVGARRFGFAPTLALAGEGGSRYGGQAWLRF